jgi:hypothetical protein
MARATDAEKRQSSQSEAGAATTGEGGRSTATAEGGQQTVLSLAKTSSDSP